jgi:hypothetical protein
MFHQSHLSGPPVAMRSNLPNHPGMGASDISTEVPDTAAPATDIVLPAVGPPAGPEKLFAGLTLTQLLIVGGVAVGVFLLIHHFNARKTAAAMAASS